MRLSLHVFTDASCRAYAAAAHLRIEDAEGKVTVNLVASKFRFVPLSGDTKTSSCGPWCVNWSTSSEFPETRIPWHSKD